MIAGPAPLRAFLAAPWSATRSRLRSWLRRQEDVRLVGEAPNGSAALRSIERAAPDLIFLHAQLPRLEGMGGFEVLAAHPRAPAVVLIAPGPDQAVRAFRARVVDYLLIPFDSARLRQCLDRVYHHLRSRAGRPLREASASTASDDRLVLRFEGRLRVVRLSDVLWVRAARRRSELHLKDGVIEADIAFGALEQRLPRESFLQINRSVIVRQDQVREVRRKSHGDHWVVLEDGGRMVLSRQRRRNALRLLGWHA